MNGSILKKSSVKYGCPVPYCREKEGSWWTCYNCNSDVCKKHEVFNGRIVPYCAMCKPEKFGLDKNRRKTKQILFLKEILS